MRCKVFELLFGQITFRVQFAEVSLIEASRDRFVDIFYWSVIPEIGIFLCGIETVDISRADDSMRSVNHIEKRRGGLTMYTPLREGPK